MQVLIAGFRFPKPTAARAIPLQLKSVPALTPNPMRSLNQMLSSL
jgi:hypothetical protein